MPIRLYRDYNNPPITYGDFSSDLDQVNYSSTNATYYAYLDAAAYYAANPSAGPVNYQEVRQDTGEIVVNIWVSSAAPVSSIKSWAFVSGIYYRLIITGIQSYQAQCDDLNPCPEGYKCVNGVCVPCDEQQATHFQEHKPIVTGKQKPKI